MKLGDRFRSIRKVLREGPNTGTLRRGPGFRGGGDRDGSGRGSMDLTKKDEVATKRQPLA